MKTILITSSLSLALTAAALASSGRTADGCSYKVINGQYLTSCEPKAQDVVRSAQAAPAVYTPVTSYDAVPVRSNSAAPQPSVQVAPQTMVMPISTPAQSSLVEIEEEKKNSELVDSVYVGAQVGSTSIKEASSSTGVGLSLGTHLDEHFGVEIAYGYTKQGLNLGLDARGTTLGDTYPARDDASLKSHLISGEVQGYLTDVSRRLRPYGGLGLAWKSSSLTEKNVGSTYSYGESDGGSLSQNSFGGIASLGTKLRVAKAFNLGFGLRYFFPISRGESKLEQGRVAYGQPMQPTRLNRGDEALTGAGQYTLQGGLEYAF